VGVRYGVLDVVERSGGGGSGPDMWAAPQPAVASSRGPGQAAWSCHTGGASLPGQGKRVLMHGPAWHSAGQWHQFKNFQTD
jgi:hypothetical protein